MMPKGDRTSSPLLAIYAELRAFRPKWHVDMGKPAGKGEMGWIAGTDFLNAATGPFHELLSRIGERAQTSDRKTIAAAFALRYGWSAGVAIAPYLTHQCAPNLALDNVSLKFTDSTLFERVALHRPEGVMLQREGVKPHPSVQLLYSPPDLLARLRESLVEQASAIVETLHDWSGFSRKGIWGMITSSWGAQFIHIHGEIATQTSGLPKVRQFFAGNDLAARTQPDFYPVTYKQVTHVYHRRATCCRYYLLPQGGYCASCPLIPQEERVQRNIEWMKTLMDSRPGEPRGNVSLPPTAKA